MLTRARRTRRLAAPLFAFLFAGLVAAGNTAAQASRVLVWSTGDAAESTYYVGAYLQDSGLFGKVTAKETGTETFTLAELLQYDMVLYYSNTNGNPVGNGDVLADYADTGRRLVVCVFSWANQGGNTLAGRLINEDICPFKAAGSSRYTTVTIASLDDTSFFNDVATITGFYHDAVALVPGAVQHGSWSDGEPIVAQKGNVVAVNLYPGDDLGNHSGDFRRLFANALASAAPATPVRGGPVPDQATATEATLPSLPATPAPGIRFVTIAGVPVPVMPAMATTSTGTLQLRPAQAVELRRL